MGLRTLLFERLMDIIEPKYAKSFVGNERHLAMRMGKHNHQWSGQSLMQSPDYGETQPVHKISKYTITNHLHTTRYLMDIAKAFNIIFCSIQADILRHAEVIAIYRDCVVRRNFEF